MASLHNLIISITIFIFFCRSSVAQQPYVGLTTSDCTNDHNSSSGLGYFCNGLNTTCRTFLTFRATPPYDTVASISTLLASDPAELSAANAVDASTPFEPNKLVLVPISCSCSGQSTYQLNASYTIVQNDTYFTVANRTFQGLSTCQAIQNQTGNPAARELAVGQRITVPLRCACPTKSQSDVGVKFLMSYLVAKGDFAFTIGERFGASVDSIFEANSLSEANSAIVDFTTLLIPLQNPPSSNQTIEDPTPPPPPPPPPQPSPSTSKDKTWLYALIGAIGGLGFMTVLGFVLYYKVLRPKKKNKLDLPILAASSESFESVEKKKNIEGGQYSEDFLEAMSDIARSIKVYSYEELSKATGGFTAGNLIKGTVFRGEIGGDPAAIKRVIDGDISKEIDLLQRINHFNVIRLSGVGFNGGYWYLVYEYASNGPLSDWIFGGKKSKSLSWVQRTQIALDVASGLNYLHSFSKPSHVHKDVKSGNILLDADFRGKIANFGMARGQDGQFSLTKHIVGTVGYMAPEYLEHGLVSTKLDVYSFGVVLLEILTGKEVSVLYEENNGKLCDVVIGGGDSVDVTNSGEIFPPEMVGFLVKIAHRCLDKNVEERPTMDEIVKLLSITLSNSLSSEMSQRF